MKFISINTTKKTITIIITDELLNALGSAVDSTFSTSLTFLLVVATIENGDLSAPESVIPDGVVYLLEQIFHIIHKL